MSLFEPARSLNGTPVHRGYPMYSRFRHRAVFDQEICTIFAVKLAERSSIRPVLGYQLSSYSSRTFNKCHRFRAKSINSDGRQHVQIDGNQVHISQHAPTKPEMSYKFTIRVQIADIR